MSFLHRIRLLLLVAALCTSFVISWTQQQLSWSSRRSCRMPSTGRIATAFFADKAMTSTTDMKITDAKSSRKSKSTDSVPRKKQSDKQRGSSSPSSSTSTLIMSARALAAYALSNVRRGSSSHHSASSRLESHPQWSSLSQRDAGFARLLVTTVERRQGQVDRLIAQLSKSKTKNDETDRQQQQQKPKRSKSATTGGETDRYIHAVLSLGIVQLLWLQVPPHAAVSETVDLMKGSRKTVHAAKYVNAVLRRVSRELDATLQKAEESLSANVAPWLWRDWTTSWGEEATLNIIQAAMRESDKCLTVRQMDGMSQDESLAAVADQFPGSVVLPQGSLRIPTASTTTTNTTNATMAHRGAISSWPGYSEGSWWVQNPSATLPAKVLYSGLKDLIKDRGETGGSSMQVIDLCAAPGGKTAQLMNYNNHQDAAIRLQVTAVEVSRRRCQRLEENQARLQMPFEIVVANASSWMPTADATDDDDNNAGTTASSSSRVDGILLDAPCTATGTGSQRPDVLRAGQQFQTPDADDDEACYGNLLETQYTMACHAVDNILSVGGLLVYATCSLQRREGEDQIQRLLSRNQGEGVAQIENVPIKPHEVPGFETAIDDNGWVRVLPGMVLDNDLEGCCDGFFVARLRRVL